MMVYNEKMAKNKVQREVVTENIDRVCLKLTVKCNQSVGKKI